MLNTLILIPTEYEAGFVQSNLRSVLSWDRIEMRLCGFGPIASGIRTAQLLSELRPASCLLIGIAGTYRSRLVVGSAYDFRVVSCYGVGVGSGSQFKSAETLGWKQWPDSHNDAANGDTLYLANSTPSSTEHPLLTVCSASHTPQDVEDRLECFPDAVAEDMEGYSVALACLAYQIPLTIIRGISNDVGDRDHSKWLVAPALKAASELAARYIASSTGESS